MLSWERSYIYAFVAKETSYTNNNNIEENIPRLLSVLCQGDVNKNLEKHQGLTRLFADVLDFVFEFDYWKVTKEKEKGLIYRVGANLFYFEFY